MYTKKIALLILIYCSPSLLYPMAVAVQRQQATQPVHKYAQQQQVQQAQAIFTQSLMKCYDAFLHAQKASGAFGPSFIDTFQTQDISLILLALTFSSANNPVLYTKACLDALYYQPADQEYPALAKTLPLLIQSFCDSSGKFTFKNNNLKEAINSGLMNGISHHGHDSLYRIWDFASNISVLKTPEWHAAWNKVLLTMQPKLAHNQKQSSCSVNQARENQYNKDLYALYTLAKNQEFTKAVQLIEQYKDDQLFQKIIAFYYSQSKEYKERTQKNEPKPQSIPKSFEKIPEQRAAAETKTQEDAKPYTKAYPLAPKTEAFLQQTSTKPQPFKTCHGNDRQQQVHKEITKINKKAADLNKKNKHNPEVKKITKEIPRFTNLAREYNNHGFVDQAYSILDFCWALLDSAVSITRGIGRGVILGIGSQVEYALENPFEFLARPLIGSFICALRLAQLTAQLINISSIGLKSLAGLQEAKDQWEVVRHNISVIKNALLTKFNTMTLEEYAQESSRLATRFILDYNCAQMLAGVYQTALTDFIQTNMATTHSLSLNAASASTLLAGNGNSLLEHVVYASGNGVTASLENTLHQEIQNLVPSIETIPYRIARNEHIPPFNATHTEIMAQSQNGPALFMTHGLLGIIKDAWHKGIEVNDNGEIWHIMRCEKTIGAIDGRTTKFLKVKKVGNVLHGQPITFNEFFTLKRKFAQ